MDDSVFDAWFGMPRETLVRRLRSLADDLENADRFDDSRVVPAVSIEDWALAKRAVPCLIGQPKGHPTVRDGKPMFSSNLYYLDERRGLARTFSRWYRLGPRVSPDFWNSRYP